MRKSFCAGKGRNNLVIGDQSSVIGEGPSLVTLRLAALTQDRRGRGEKGVQHGCVGARERGGKELTRGHGEEETRGKNGMEVRG